MIRTLLASLALTFAMLFGSVHVAHADTKIAYIDVDKVIESAGSTRKELDKVRTDTAAKLAPLKKQLDAIDKELQTLEKSEAANQKRLELTLKKQGILEQTTRIEKDGVEAAAKVRSAATEKVMKVAAALTQEGKYDYCFDARVVFTGPKGDDLTNAAIKRLDGTK